MKRYIPVLMLACSIPAHSQQQASFLPPFDFPLTLSGNFGEIRANHFHGGLDFKTGGQVGKPVKALNDGYVSRIRVTFGSGYVLDVIYNNGYTTINRHLQGFVFPMAQRVEDLQYKQESYEIEIVPQPGEYPVKAGQTIAWSGNTGYSMGPHLHLDVFETATGDYIDPILFFKKHIKDTTAPKAEAILLFPQKGSGVINGKFKNQSIAINGARPAEAWGVIGVGIKAYDYMNGVQNYYGVYSVALAVDGHEVFRSTVDRFSLEETRMINSWTYGQYMKSFIDPGNTLRMLKVSGETRGLITIDKERNYQFVYTLADAFGNTSHYRFTIRGKRQPIEPFVHREKYLFAWDKTNYLQEPGLTLVIPKGMLYDHLPLNYHVKVDSGAIAFTYQLHDQPISLHSGCELRIGLRHKPVADSTKYYLARVAPNGGYHHAGGKYENGSIKENIRQLGTYTIAVDTVPPVITPVAAGTWARTGKIVYSIQDKTTGIRSYRATIDGTYALFARPNLTRTQYVCILDPKRIKKGKKHTVEMVAIDGCGNETLIRNTFSW